MHADRELVTTAMVVPCFNEADRLDVEAFVAFVETRPWLTFIFVDDGSTDGTRDLIATGVGRSPGQIHTLALDNNCGKAEAVRRGLLSAFEQGTDLVGFWDADLATPLVEIDVFRQYFERQPELELAIGSRVQLLGKHIERNPVRHYFGRVAATLVSLILGIPVYDTQCGAKAMRSTNRVREIFAEPFVTCWAFDVEILARWLISPRADSGAEVDRGIVEIPVDRWVDVPGSRIRLRDFAAAPLAIWRIWREYGRSLRRTE